MEHRVYYNEIDPFCAAWLRELIADGQIPAGVVDERDIRDVLPSDLDGYEQCHFFCGLGGWPYAFRLADWTRPAWTGSPPCQPFSVAGSRAGFADERHLWPAYFHLISQCRPPKIFGEQVASSLEWCGLVRSDLQGVGYAVGAIPIEAASVGAPHRRDRMWFVADTEWNEQPRQEPCCGTDRRMGWEQQQFPWYGGWQQALARFRTLDNGIPRRVAATDAARNAIVPQVAAEFIRACA